MSENVLPLIEFPAAISLDFDGYIGATSAWNFISQSTGILRSIFSFFLDHFSKNCFTTIEFGSNFSKSMARISTYWRNSAVSNYWSNSAVRKSVQKRSFGQCNKQKDQQKCRLHHLTTFLTLIAA